MLLLYNLDSSAIGEENIKSAKKCVPKNIPGLICPLPNVSAMPNVRGLVLPMRHVCTFRIQSMSFISSGQLLHIWDRVLLRLPNFS